MLYGASPFSDTLASKLDLRPAMTLTSKVIAVQYFIQEIRLDMDKLSVQIAPCVWVLLHVGTQTDTRGMHLLAHQY